MTLDLVNTLDITDDTVAILVENDPQLISSQEVEGIIDALQQINHPKAQGLMILTGRDLRDALSNVTEAEMNRLGWFRRRH